MSLKVAIIINQEQLDIGWNVDYLGYYKYVESYVSSNGYKVNIIESTGKGVKAVGYPRSVLYLWQIEYTIQLQE